MAPESTTTTSTPREVNFITGNANKLSEVRAILEPVNIAVRSQALDLPEIQGTLEAVTREKCRVAADLVGGPVLVEDTCLCFDALNGLPGPYMYVFFPFFPFFLHFSFHLICCYTYIYILPLQRKRKREKHFR